MSSPLVAWPKQTAFGRVLPKNKIYEHAKPSTSVKEQFVRQVDQIIWQYKLAPETIHLPSTKNVPEIQIFSITLKSESLGQEVLRCIDQAVQFPIVFELSFDDKTQMVACYKRPNEADRSKWVRSEYFSTDWIGSNAKRIPLPAALNLGSLYEHLLRGIIPIASGDRESISSLVSRMEKIRTKQREVDQVAGRLAKEKQFNRKVELNATLRKLRQELESLRSASCA